MKHSDYATLNWLAVSLLSRETAMNTEQTCDTKLHIDKNTMVSPNFRNETDKDKANGYMGPSVVYKRGKTAQLGLNFDKLMFHEALLILAYGLGGVTTVAAGATGYKHTIIPLSSRLDANRSLPTFTMAESHAEIEKRLWASGAVSGFKFNFGLDDWLKATADIVFSGKKTSNMTKITTASIADSGDATTVALTDSADNDYAVADSDPASAAVRLANIDYVRAQLNADGIWHDVVVTAASAATPAVLTIAAPGISTDDVVFEICFKGTQPAWATAPAFRTEPSLYVTALDIVLGGKFNPSTGLVEGGRNMNVDFKSFELSATNNGQMTFGPNGGADYANQYIITGQDFVITLARQLSDLLLDNMEEDNTQFAVQARAVSDEFESGHNFELRLCCPLCQVLDPKRGTDNDRLSQTTTVQVLNGHASGPIVATIINKCATAAA